MAHLNKILVYQIAFFIYGCGFFFGDSYEDDVANDRNIVNEIIRENPVLDSAVKAGHYFLPYSGESGRIEGSLDLSDLRLNDTNFHFPPGIRNFRIVNVVHLSFNDFTDLPAGTRQKKWKRVGVLSNRICSPGQETVEYLDKLLEDYIGGYWRDYQRCEDSIPAASL